MNKYIRISLIALLVLIPIYFVVGRYGVQLKTSHCMVNRALPDPKCTPGAVLTTDAKIVCVSGYTKTVRNVSTATKKKVFKEYGISYSQHGNYEVDHLISLELGGSNDISNLWPENSTIINGSLTKDKFENYLHKQVCDGVITLAEAQGEISSDWVKYAKLSTATANPTTTPTTATQTPTSNSTPTNTTNNNYFIQYDNTVPVDVTAKCNDGTYSYSQHRQGTCSHHGGVAEWY